jgi:hypothetical protein
MMEVIQETAKRPEGEIILALTSFRNPELDRLFNVTISQTGLNSILES